MTALDADARFDRLEELLLRAVEAPPAVYTVAQAANVLQLSPKSIRRLVTSGALRKLDNVGDRILIPRADVDTFAKR